MIKDNQTMQFFQLTEYSIRSVYLEKSYTKFCRETCPTPFLKKSTWLSGVKFITP